MFALVAIPVLLLVLFVPGEALAWGPVTHLHVGRLVLDTYRDVLSVSAACVLDYPLSFLYGSIAPDRFLAKNLKRYSEHTHNWDQAFNMLRYAGTDELRAFSLGYLSHLAGDVVAHNLYVPTKIMMNRGVGNRMHAYWEMRFEEKQPPEAWDLARLADHAPGAELLDRFMGMFQSPSLFSFRTNLSLTRTAFKFMESDRMRRAMGRLNRRRPLAIQDDEVQQYVDLCATCVSDLLVKGRDSRCVDADPSGRARIRHAHSVVRAMGAVVGSRTRNVFAPTAAVHAGVPGQGRQVVLPGGGEGSGAQFESLRAPDLEVTIEIEQAGRENL
jgi:hypothetical protein